MSEPNYDNPMARIFSDVLKNGKGPKKLTDYLGLITPGFKKFDEHIVKSTADVSSSVIFKSLDPNKLIPNMGSLRQVSISDISGDLNFGSYAQSSFLRDVSDSSFLSGSGERHNPIFLWDKNKKALFFGHETVGFAPLPISRGRGPLGGALVNIGYKSYSSVRMNGRSASDYIYSALNDMLGADRGNYGLDRIVKAANNFWGISTNQNSLGSLLEEKSYQKAANVGKLLRGGVFVRGVNNSITSALNSSTKNIVGFGRGHFIDSPVGKLISNFSEAQKVVNYITKTGYSPVKGEDAVEAFEKAKGIIEAFPRIMFGTLQRMGVAEGYPYVNPKYFLGGNNLVIPHAENIKAIFGNLPLSKSAREKGLYQEFKIATLTTGQLERMGAHALPPFMLRSYYNAAKESAITNALYRGQPLTIGVMDFNNPLFSRLYTQEGGAISTGSRKLATRLPTGEITLRVGSTAAADNLGSLFGVSFSGGKFIGNQEIRFTEKDIDRALRTDTKYKKLSPIQRKIRSFFGEKGSGKKYSGLLDRIGQFHGDMFLSSAELRGNQAILSFTSREDLIASSTELVAGSRRLTAIEPLASHDMFELKRIARSLGVDYLVSHDEFLKMHHDKVFLENFFDVAKRNNMLNSVMSEMGISTGHIPILTGKKRYMGDVPLIGDARTAHQKAQEIVKKWAGGTSEEQKIAEKVMRGTALDIDNSVLSKLGINSIRTFTMMGGLRTDFMHDINLMKSTRINPKKLINLANRSRLLGYSSPSEDPIFRTYWGLLKNLRKGEIDFNEELFEFFLPDSSRLKMASQAIFNRHTPEEKYVMKLSGGKFSRKGVELKKLPDYESFRQSRTGGVKFQSLKGTILDRSNPKLTFIDLGKEVNVRLSDTLEAPIRYFPIPSEYIRTTKGVDGRLSLSESHVASHYVKVINRLESGADPNDISDLLGKAIQGFGRTLSKGGTSARRGMMENLNTVLIKSGLRVRLAPQRSNAFNARNFTDTDNLFNVYASKSEIVDALVRKQGMAPAEVKSILDDIKHNKFTHVLLNIDPTQRAEHHILARLMIRDNGSKKSFFGQVSLEMHPLLFRMTERDTDRDVANLLFPGVHGANRAELEAQIARQREKIAPFMWWHKYELEHGISTAKDFNLLGSMRNAKNRILLKLTDASESLGFESFAKFLSQKTEAPSGYTLARSVDKYINPMAFGNAEELANLGIDPTVSGIVDKFRKVTSKEKVGVAEALMQSLYQGGVSKASESTLLDVRQELAKLRASVSANPGAYTFESIAERSTEIFKTFLESQSSKRREFMAAPFLINRLREKGVITKSNELVLADLERELSSHLSRVPGVNKEFAREYTTLQKHIMNEAANVLGETFGVAYGIGNLVKNKPKGILDVLQRRITSPGAVASMFADLAGVRPDQLGTATISEKIASKSVAEIGKELGTFFSHPSTMKGLLIGAGVGLGAAVVGINSGGEMFGDSPLPPPMQEFMPSDYGPSVPSIQAPPKIYTSSTQIPRYASSSSYGGFNPPPASSIGSRSYTDVVVRNKTHSMSEYLMLSDMRRSSNSDF